MGGAKNFLIEMEHEQAAVADKDAEIAYLRIMLKGAQREVQMLREHLKWLEAHHKNLTDHLLNMLSLNKIALP